VEQPFPVLPGELSESFFAITDGLPFYSVGRATQTIAGVGTAKATLVSSVQVTIRIFDALVPALDGFVTTTSEYRPTSSSAALLKVLTTQVRDSTLTQLPVVGEFVEGFKFPTSETLEQIRAGSSEVQVEHTYLSETVRIARNSNRQVFVYIKDEPSDPFGGFDEEFGADASEESDAPRPSSASPPPAYTPAVSPPRVELGIADTAFSGDNEPAWVEFTEFSEDVSPD